MSEKTANEFKISWSILTVLVAVAAVLGVGWWENWRLTVPAPGLFAGMGFVFTVFIFVLAVWFVVVCTVYRNVPIVKRFAVWMAAVILAVGGLAFYAHPDFPAIAFYIALVLAGVILYVERPLRSR